MSSVWGAAKISHFPERTHFLVPEKRSVIEGDGLGKGKNSLVKGRDLFWIARIFYLLRRGRIYFSFHVKSQARRGLFAFSWSGLTSSFVGSMKDTGRP